LVFTAVMLLAAIVMWRRSTRTEPAAPPTAPRWVVVLAALAVGTLTGTVGVGGGFLMVPVLAGVLGLPMPVATATSLAVIALNATAASLGWLGKVTLDLRLTAAVTIAALVGMAIGTAIAPRFSARTLTRAFAVLLIGVAVVMIGMEL